MIPLLLLVAGCSTAPHSPLEQCSASHTSRDGYDIRVCRHFSFDVGIIFCCERTYDGVEVGDCSHSYDRAREECER